MSSKTALQLVEQYLSEKHVMQLATVSDSKPWICTVYFVADRQRNLYWASLPTRRHSKDIQDDPQVAIAIKVQGIIGKPVIGMQAEGKVEVLTAPDRAIVAAYAKRFQRDKSWVEDMVSGRTQHQMYKFVPSAFYLFDEAHFPGGERLAL